jgi:hypothetical protein
MLRSGSRKALFLASAVLAGVGVIRSAGAAPVAQTQSPATIDGWTISWPTPGVGLAITQDGSNSNQVNIEKSATFKAVDQGFQISFVPGSNPTADTFVLPDETITNLTGKPFSGFSFILINTGSVNATFGGVSPGFIPPTGPGYDYTTVSLTNGKTELDYKGTQGDGVTSFWGNGDPSSAGDNLVIDAPAGSIFSLKELSVGGGNVVPVPAAAWQSLIGLGCVAGFAAIRSMKRRTV